MGIYASLRYLIMINWSLAIAMDTYIFKISNFPNVDYHCPADGIDYLKLPQQHCILQCIQMQGCAAVNHNRTSGLCTMLPAPCPIGHHAIGMEYTVLTGRRYEQCLKWVPYIADSPLPDVIVISPDGFIACRLFVSNGIFGGHFNHVYQGCWATDGITPGLDATNHAAEILTVPVGCTLGWVKYTAEDPLPPTSLVAGRSYDGDNLYVAMLTLPEFMLPGYYNAGASLSYATGYNDIFNSTEMDLLVVL